MERPAAELRADFLGGHTTTCLGHVCTYACGARMRMFSAGMLMMARMEDAPAVR
jgi:hypothetical protein